MAFIANKPVRFDRTYAIGEVIPDDVIDPKMVRRLLDMGRILSVDLPAPSGIEKPPAFKQKAAQDGAENEDGVNTQEKEETPTEDAEGGVEEPPQDEPEVPAEDAEYEGEPEDPAPNADGEFICPDCGKAFGSKNALSAHSRSHKK